MAKSNVAWMILLAGSLLVLGVGKHIGGRQGLLLAFILILVINGLIYFYGDIRLKKLFHSKKLEGRDPFNLIDLRNELARELHMEPPSIRICDLVSPTAFSLGRNQNSACIVISKNLVQELSPQELRAVLACEMYKIKEQLTFSATLCSALAAFSLGSAEKVDKLISFNRFSPEDLGPFAGLLAPLVSKMISGVQSKNSLLEIDKRSSLAIHSPKDLASAIWKLDSLVKTQPSLVPKDMAHLFFINPLPNYGWAKLFHNQPSAKERIENLTGQFPI